MTFICWFEEVLKERFGKRAWLVNASALQFVITDIEFNPNGWAIFKCFFSGEVIWRIPLGWLDRTTLSLPMPMDTRLFAVVDKTINMFERWVCMHLSHAYQQDPGFSRPLVTDDYPLLNMLESNLKFGSPAPIPVPKPGVQAFQLAAKNLKAVTPEVRRRAEARIREIHEKPLGPPIEVIAVFQLKNWLIALSDYTTEGLYSEAGIFVLNANIDFAAQVFNKTGFEGGATIDGDVFSLRRFLQLFRGAIQEAGLDREICFSARSPDGAEQTSLKITDWLSFNIPDEEEDSLFNWKLQSYGASAGAVLPRTAMSATEEKFWRAFLKDAVDPRLRESSVF